MVRIGDRGKFRCVRKGRKASQVPTLAAKERGGVPRIRVHRKSMFLAVLSDRFGRQSLFGVERGVGSLRSLGWWRGLAPEDFCPACFVCRHSCRFDCLRSGRGVRVGIGESCT